MHTDATSLSDAPEYSALIHDEPPYVAEEDESPDLAVAELRETVAGAIASLPGAIAAAVQSGAITLQVGVAIASGERDENKLTNLVFNGRHPELPSGYRIQSG